MAHYYGLTETYGPGVGDEAPVEWAALPAGERARLFARQGNALLTGHAVRVVDPEGHDVPADGATMGEVLFRGNTVTPGYFGDEAATAASRRGAWMASGDLGVMHPDHYVELRDRSKDIIISGGENIASIEVEQAIASHPAVLEVAVVAIPDAHWGEVPGAFVTLKPGRTADGAEIVDHVRQHLARFKAPKHVWFGPLPKTGSGKVQKLALRARAEGLATEDGATPA